MILPNISGRDEHLSESGKAEKEQSELTDPQQERLPVVSPKADTTPTEQSEDVRWWLVETAREQIKNNCYDEDAKLDAILDRLAEDLGVELTDKDKQEAHHAAHP